MLKRLKDFNTRLLEGLDTSSVNGFCDELNRISSNVPDDYSSEISEISDGIYWEMDRIEAEYREIEEEKDKIEDLYNSSINEKDSLNVEITELKEKISEIETEKEDLDNKIEDLNSELEKYTDIEYRFSVSKSTIDKEESLKASVKLMDDLFKNVVSIGSVIEKLEDQEIKILEKYIRPDLLEAIRGKGSSLIRRFDK